MVWELLFVVFIVLVGAFVQGASGFGLGLVVMGFLPFILSVKESTLLVLSFLAATALTILVKNYRSIKLKGLIIFVVASFAGRIASFFVLTTYGEMDVLKTWLGVFLIGLVVYLYFSNKKNVSLKKINPFVPLSLGLLNGFFGGLFAVGGTFLVVYCLYLYKEDKHRYTANVQVVTLMTSSFSLLLHGVNGDFDLSFLLYFAVGLVSVIIGAILGLRWFEKLPTSMIRTIAMMLVLVAALNLILFS
ncbi:sulfite exporter TauE/SafE family protein [Salicibibacter kimchii]|uniref:Probable membrane transporter protein n=1 Tax=Salicibibacter kimchii TaxID=2099786 RepID=A0A345C222_9BACI|nr:sulfite exporter TauE/SafE family protein [Salicibibacter kimchii]AXF57253.1 sulfite exporter TauE/SafE family protein [Salicibibacter kimchii]